MIKPQIKVQQSIQEWFPEEITDVPWQSTDLILFLSNFSPE